MFVLPDSTQQIQDKLRVRNVLVDTNLYFQDPHPVVQAARMYNDS